MKNLDTIKNKFLYDFNFLMDPKIINELILYQLGEIYCDDNAVSKTHTHWDFFELTFIVSGKGVIYCDDVPIKVKKNDLFVSLPFERHKIISDSKEPLRYYFISFSFIPDSKFKTDILYSPTLLHLPTHLRVHNSQAWATTFVSLLSVIQESTKFSDLKFELMVKTFCISLWQTYQELPTTQYTSPKGFEEQNLFYKIIHYIDEHLTNINNLTEIADALHYNYVYISRIFKLKSGKSIYQYFSERKLLLAEQLLKEGDMSITKIAEHLNYSSIYVFSRSFKKYFGVSPSFYESQQNKE
ncbi:MAG: helix-turn-helix transcriptional regulator [Clostridia bacterium]|nr:helix-turn-helix transcriptional regulator [Clostridia bacterium]